ncbi:hypothetical protein OHA18_39175 [Kribbella sp. NBC_00709]|uniref:hypothetical protein n=1 Tax=Kribbella sp. NBC_00709 TaxID=2975972 RepID=UPI002E2D0CA4|nr:hypothetical protein [Kribbella sp. NBC_00709]
MSHTVEPRRKRTRTVRRSHRRTVVAVNIAEAVITLPCLVAAYGLAEHLVAAQEAAGAHHVASRSVGWSPVQVAITLNMSLLIVGAAAGAVGSVIRQSMMFARTSAPNHQVSWYIMRPLWSALLASVSVIAVNTGLISIGDETTSSAGVAVLVLTGALTGLFTDQALNRLRRLLNRPARGTGT